jgi:prophage antirepressor-like protein
MDLKCPGRIGTAPKETFIVSCPSCKREVEMFQDEPKVRCRCGQWVFQEVLPSCVKWCAAAAQCMGVEGLAESMQRAQATPDREEQEQRLREIREVIEQVRYHCAERKAADMKKASQKA